MSSSDDIFSNVAFESSKAERGFSETIRPFLRTISVGHLDELRVGNTVRWAVQLDDIETEAAVNSYIDESEAGETVHFRRVRVSIGRIMLSKELEELLDCYVGQEGIDMDPDERALVLDTWTGWKYVELYFDLSTGCLMEVSRFDELKGADMYAEYDTAPEDGDIDLSPEEESFTRLINVIKGLAGPGGSKEV